MSNQISVSLDGDELVILATRSGFAELKTICSRLALLCEAELNTPASHYHLMPEMNNLAPGSMRVVLQVVKEEEWKAEGGGG